MISGTRKMLADEVDRHGLIKILTRVNPVVLPSDAPTDVVSAWIRLHGQGAKDIALIEKWLRGDHV